MTSNITQKVSTTIPTRYGPAKFTGYWDSHLQVEHLLIQFGDSYAHASEPSSPLVRVHSECITGEAFGSLKCECGPQLEAAMREASEQSGIVIYLRGQEGRGIGLLNKLRAYSLQEQGYDTVDANLKLGLPAEAREFAPAAEMLKDVGVSAVRLMSNNPEKIHQLREAGIDVEESVPLIVGVQSENVEYLRAKSQRMGHTISSEAIPGTPEQR